MQENQTINKHSGEVEIRSKDMIVSSTDTKGNIIYVNDIFCEISGYSREELMGKPHNIVRHEEMPKAVFKLLWQQVSAGKIIYAFVKNKTKDGGYYWVKAYLKPIIKDGKVVQITSYRKQMNSFAKEYIEGLYKKVLAYEEMHSADESLQFLMDYLEKLGLSYEQFIDRLAAGKAVDMVNTIDSFKYKNAHIIYKAHIINAIKNGVTDVKVTGSDECAFGKMCHSLSHEPFTATPEWREMLKYHEHVHYALQQYVDRANEGADEDTMNRALANVQKDTELIFNNLNHLIDTYKG